MCRPTCWALPLRTASMQAKQHASTVQCRDPTIYCIISTGRSYVSSDLPVPVSRVALGMS